MNDRNQERDNPEDEDVRQLLGGHAAILAVYGFLVASVVAVAAATNRTLPEAMSGKDILMTAAASHKLARTLTKAEIARPIRTPVTRKAGDGGPGEVSETPSGRSGLRRSIGTLLTCPFCMDLWAVTGFTVARIFAPRLTHVVVNSLAVWVGADFFQLAYAKAQELAEG
ncbi:DUF1360 domain-containing protein [Rhodococcus sp. 24CO]|uniref:DUF1360 domain-containing protein n=1 Tax=Rhodococcus sp. 24CO TaxID=3117460 RepID=UPI003D335230